MRRLPHSAAAALLLALTGCGTDPGFGGSGGLSGAPTSATTAPRPVTAQPVAADGGLQCPATMTDREGRVVPEPPQGVDGRAGLLPDRPPLSLVDCAYPVVVSGAATPTGPPFAVAHRTLVTGDRVDDVVGLLAWAPRDTGRGTVCTAMAGPETVHLVGARYADAIVWVASLAEANRCKPATNGDFRSPLPVGYQLEQWFGAHPTGNPTEPVCNRWVGGRLDDDQTLVPTGDPTVTICRATSTGSEGQALSTDRSRLVVSALRSLRTEPTEQMCTDAPPYDGTGFRLVLDYGRGPDVMIDVVPGCQPELRGPARSARDAGPVIDLVEQWSPPGPGFDPNGSVSSTGTHERPDTVGSGQQHPTRQGRSWLAGGGGGDTASVPDGRA